MNYDRQKFFRNRKCAAGMNSLTAAIMENVLWQLLSISCKCMYILYPDVITHEKSNSSRLLCSSCSTRFICCRFRSLKISIFWNAKTHFENIHFLFRPEHTVIFFFSVSLSFLVDFWFLVWFSSLPPIRLSKRSFMCLLYIFFSKFQSITAEVHFKPIVFYLAKYVIFLYSIF